MGADIGLFGRYSAIHGRSSLDADNGVIPGVVVQTVDLDFSIDHKMWLVGGKIGVDFNLL